MMILFSTDGSQVLTAIVSTEEHTRRAHAYQALVARIWWKTQRYYIQNIQKHYFYPSGLRVSKEDINPELFKKLERTKNRGLLW